VFGIAMKPIPTFVPLLLSSALLAQTPPALASTSTMPVREVTVFKDGHAYVLRDMALPVGADGTVVIDDLPAPVLGTFWPFATDGARLVAAKASRVRLGKDVTATDLRLIARANVGKSVVVVTNDKERITGKLLAVPQQEADAAGSERSTLPAEATLLLVQTEAGVRAGALAHVRDLEVQGEFQGKVRDEYDADRLTLTVAGGGDAARIGVTYVQKGLRWIPSYRIDIDGAGKAVVQLEATLVNDLLDLEGAVVHLVVGVPKFAFKDLVDPMSLRREVAQLAAQADDSRFSNFLSNSIQTQVMSGGRGRQSEAAGERAVDVGGEANEDLFVFLLRDVTLKKGERLVVPVSSRELTYRDLYRLDVPFSPPMEMRQHFPNERAIELARELAAPKARHVLRLKNGNEAPLTTAPALVLNRGKVLAQGRMTYTSKGGDVDLEINVAIDVRVDVTEEEKGRADSVRRAGHDYSRVDMSGSIALRNGKSTAVEIEVSRRVLGLLGDVGQGGGKAQLDPMQAWDATSAPAWLGWWSWPWWWFQHNGFAEARWTVQLAPGAATQLDASWQYFWR
jgi:hypothetical protein